MNNSITKWKKGSQKVNTNSTKIPGQPTKKSDTMGIDHLRVEKNLEGESPKFLKYFFRDCIENSDKMNHLVELQRKQVEDDKSNSVNNGATHLNKPNHYAISNDQLQSAKGTEQNEQFKGLHPQLVQSGQNQLFDIQKILSQTFNAPIMPHIPQNFSSKIASFDSVKLAECLAELKPVIIGKKKTSTNANEWHVAEQEVLVLLKKQSLEGQKALITMDYKQALICFKKSEILMNAFVARDGKIDNDSLLFLKANLGICYYRIGLLSDAFQCFSICLVHLKKKYGNLPKYIYSLMHCDNNSYSQSIQQKQKKRSYSNLPNIDQAEYMQMLAQRLKQKRLKGDILLQACIVLSEQGNHDDALILGNKASKLHLNYVIDTLIVCYHLILSLIKERDHALSESNGSFKTQSARRGNSAHFQSGSSNGSGSSTCFTSQRDKFLTQMSAPYNIFEGDFVQELGSPLQQSQAHYQLSSLKERIAYIEKVIPILKEIMKRTTDLHAEFVNPSKLKILELLNRIIVNQNERNITSLTNNCRILNGNLEVSLFERPDLEFLFQNITNRNHWILKTNILSLLQLKSVPFEDTQILKTSIEQEIFIDSILNKVSHLCVSFYCISTETRFINDSKKNKLKEVETSPQGNNQNITCTQAPTHQSPSSHSQSSSKDHSLAIVSSQNVKYAKFLQNLNYCVSESENWLSRSLEIAYIFLPHDMPLVGQIVSVHNKFHNVNKIVICEHDQEHDEDSDLEEEILRSHPKSNYSISEEYASPLVTLPGGSKSNFFIPLVRKIKPKITRSNTPRDTHAEEEIALLYNSYPSQNMIPSSSTEQSTAFAQANPPNDRSQTRRNSKNSTSLNQKGGYYASIELNSSKIRENQFVQTGRKTSSKEDAQSVLSASDKPNHPFSNKDPPEKVKKQSNPFTIGQAQNIMPSSQGSSNTGVLSSTQPVFIQLKKKGVNQNDVDHLNGSTDIQHSKSSKHIKEEGGINISAQQNVNLQRLSRTEDFAQQVPRSVNPKCMDEDQYDEMNQNEFQMMNSNIQQFVNQTTNSQQQQQQQTNSKEESKKSVERSQVEKNAILVQQQQQFIQQQLLASGKQKERKQHSQELKGTNNNGIFQGMNYVKPIASTSTNQNIFSQSSQINQVKKKKCVMNLSSDVANCPQFSLKLSNFTSDISNTPNRSQDNASHPNNEMTTLLSQPTNGPKATNPFSMNNNTSPINMSNSTVLNQNSNYPQSSDLLSNPQNSQQSPDVTNYQLQLQQQLKKIILQKPLSSERKYRSIENSQYKVIENQITNPNALINQPQSTKNVSLSTGVTARQQNTVEMFEVKRKASTGSTSSKIPRKTAKSNGAAQNQNRPNFLNYIPSNAQQNATTGFVNSNLLVSQKSQISEGKRVMKNNFVQEQILSEIFDINNTTTKSPRCRQASQHQQQPSNLHFEILNGNLYSSQQVPSQQNSVLQSQTGHQPQQKQLAMMNRQQFQNQMPASSNVNGVQQQLISQLTNNNQKRPHSKENASRSSSSKNDSQLRKNKKNLDIQVTHPIAMNLNTGSAAAAVDVNGSKSSRNSSNLMMMMIQENNHYLPLGIGSQSTKSSSQQNPSLFLNQTSKNSTPSNKDSFSNCPIGLSLTTRYPTPKSSGATNLPIAVNANEKKMQMRRKFRSSVGKVPDDLFKQK